MSILSRLEELRGRTKKLLFVRAEQKNRSRLEVLRDGLRDQAGQLNQVASAAKCLREAGLKLPPAERDQQRLVEGFEALSKDQKSDPTSQFSPQAAAKNKKMMRVLEEERKAWKKQMLEAWKAHVADCKPNLEAQVLDVLGGVPSLRSAVATVRQSLKKLETLESELPVSAEYISQVADIASEAKETWGRLGGGSLPDSILEFLRDAGADGAALSAYDSEVQAWMDDRGISDAFCIQMRRR